jgi:transcriptional regulator with PAS, ATPase and Fis domain
VAANLEMKQLIEQAIKIADSEIFVLIQGESGTGKELFARLIHSQSKRRDHQFVALNCAAIPESLLESELFGHEKGAFTGAYAQHKGKLELASGGTLVLDEIGDMPLMLQAKLLRALQESEFYRLGGSKPIKVDLRLMSLTHQNLEELIRQKKFREDLYFRLVHRTLEIPPLRDRPEDIPPLINHFSNQYCSLLKKSIKGYSVKAYDALQKYHWRGNVRQLENEIKSLVNLTDGGEIVDFDLLSRDIKKSYQEIPDNSESTDPRLWAVIDPGSEETGKLPTFKFYAKPDKKTILKYLEMNNWNKSKTAEALNMTYQGLHKKMNQLGITKKKDK